jgi:isopentenyl-diphosphate Delta-isomerase
VAEEQVIVVNERDEPVGVVGKTAAHRDGILHRAISVFIFDETGRMLLQQRAFDKYHSPGLWSNACCSHPRPGEGNGEAAERRLLEEMGIRTALEFKTTFTYRAEFSNGLIEHEVDHVFTGVANDQPVINPAEAAGYRWQYAEEILKEISADESRFTKWFVIAMRMLKW